MRPKIVVIGLGPGDSRYLDHKIHDLISESKQAYARTRLHPCVPLFSNIQDFDSLYRSTESFDGVYKAICKELIESAKKAALDNAYITYCVPGSPAILEDVVEMLLGTSEVDIDLVGNVSFMDLAFERLRIDPFKSTVTMIDAQGFNIKAQGNSGPFLIAQCWSKELLSEIKLALLEDNSDGNIFVTVLEHLGCDDELVRQLPIEDLDREITPDHMTTVYIPNISRPPGVELVRLVELIRTLRDRCPWDKNQTHQSLATHLLEETYEVLEAISNLPGTTLKDDETRYELQDDPYGAYEHLCEELGDLLVQVVFHSTLASEYGYFNLSDIARITTDKLVNRHPHVFGTLVAETPQEVMSNWEQIKKVEKGRETIMDGIPSTLPALLFAQKVQKKAATVGFDWPDFQGPMVKIAEEFGELRKEVGLLSWDPGKSVGGRDSLGVATRLANDRVTRTGARNSPVAADNQLSARIQDELGDLLFSVVNLGRHLGLDCEESLRKASNKFRERFRVLELYIANSGRNFQEMSMQELDGLWETAKGGPIGDRGSDLK